MKKNKSLFIKILILILISISILISNFKDDILYISISHKYNTLAKVCIIFHANINMHRQSNFTLLHTAAAVDNVEMVKLLLKKGLDVNAKSLRRTTPLMVALEESSSVEMIIMLINSGSDITLKDMNGRTVMFYAVESGNIENIKVLSPYIKNWNERDLFNKSLLFMINEWYYSKDIVKYLLDKGVNPYFHDNTKMTFIDYAKKNLTHTQYEEVLLLLSHYINN
jgi:ankyrin repeat protein